MQIKINLKVFAFALFFCLTNQLKIYLLLMLFAIIHEIGHILSGILLGLKVQKLEILPIGIAVSFKLDTIDFNKKILKANLLTIKKLVIALAGPLVNLIFIILFILLGKEKILNIETELLIYINILIFLFNMLMIYPLDGGRIIKNILYIFLGKENALKITNILSNLNAVLLTIFVVYISYISQNFTYFFAVIYIWFITIRENKIYKMRKKFIKYCEIILK